MTLPRIAGVLLLVLACAVALFARDVGPGGGFAVFSLGLAGVVLVLRAPRSSAQRAEDERKRLQDLH